RPLMRWYVEPLAYEQRMFNDAALKLIDALWEEADALRAADSDLRQGDDKIAERLNEARYSLSERLDEQSRATADSQRTVRGLEARLTRTGRRRDGGAPRTVAPQPRADAFPDYFAFESKLRGRTEGVRERQSVYVDDFREAAPVLDIGCGRGELLGLLREAGVDARGIDPDADMVAFARGEGLDVEQDDAVSYL